MEHTDAAALTTENGKNAAGLSLGLDIGSTTVKLVAARGTEVVWSRYERHFSQVRLCALHLLQDAAPALGRESFSFALSGSAGLGLAESAGLPFVQEVYATGRAVARLWPETDVAVELGGEDAKVIFFSGGADQRMNGSCAGGTGAFIDQMAVLLDMTVEEMDAASLAATRLYPVASRCGVFAKSDVQPLLNQGASKADVAASIYQAVVDQTITGLAQGRRIGGRVLFLGGPLYYCAGLRRRFRETLGLDEETGFLPELARFTVALGAALYAAETDPRRYDCAGLMGLLENAAPAARSQRLAPLFATEEEYADFRRRHDAATLPERELASYSGRAWLGIDCGSTTTKLALIAADKSLLWSYYGSNRGDPVTLVRQQLLELRRLTGDRVEICGAAVTGYGEELIRRAFRADLGLVETMAHFRAARWFCPEVDFILDIGGQDIKCFRIRGGGIDSIMLNEACSSGCGSFLETFARSLGYTAAEFAALSLHSQAPVNLGSRCTVFMNSAVKQSQKEGAAVEDISAGLAVSVVKNAIYKVIRAHSPKELGEHIVVQGGTLMNDGVLRALELELGGPVIRPAIAPLMGAFGAALSVMDRERSTLLSAEALRDFTHRSHQTVCKGCANHCHLTVNDFGEGRPYISGNQCQRALGLDHAEDLPDLHAWKREFLHGLTPAVDEPADPRYQRGLIGLPLALSTFELAPLWVTLWRELGFDPRLSPPSDRATYELGQFSIPSDTACYPAKIMHGHVEKLLAAGIRRIFYPCLSYNVDEGSGDNHYNCPIVAYYGELLRGNMDGLRQADFLDPYLSLDSPAALSRTLWPTLHRLDPAVGKAELKQAARRAFAAYEDYLAQVRRQGKQALDYAKAHGKRVLILAGRPYHIDPEIGHGIDKLALSLGFVVVSEDSVCQLAPRQGTHVLDQWTYHARLYRAARFAAEREDVDLVQLVSFGCGMDAITSDEVREILERQGKFYTQIKIDEITNLGAVKIRLRSLAAALEERQQRREEAARTAAGD